MGDPRELVMPDDLRFESGDYMRDRVTRTDSFVI
jgi:hypothetical protein